jgi:hypothetical protein
LLGWQSHPIKAGCQEAAMIHKRGKRWRVIVYAGRDPITGRKRQKSQYSQTTTRSAHGVCRSWRRISFSP